MKKCQTSLPECLNLDEKTSVLMFTTKIMLPLFFQRYTQ